MKRGYAGFLLAVALLAAGCATWQRDRVAAINTVFMKTDACLQAGDTNGALTVLSRAMASSRLIQGRGAFYDHYLRILFMGGRADEARAHYLNVIGKDEALTRAGFRVLSGYLQFQDPEAYQVWIEQMLAAALPLDLQTQVYGQQMRILLGKGQIGKAVELAPVCISKFDAGVSRGILGEAVRSEMAAERFDNAGKLLDAVEKHAGTVQSLKDMAAIARTDILFMKGDWAAAEPQFGKVAASLADGDLAGWLPSVVGVCIGKGQLDLGDRLCEFVLKNQKEKAGSRNQAASRWIEVAKARKNLALIPARLEALKDLAIPPPVLFSMFQTDYYVMLGDTNRADIVAMMTFGDKLEALLPRPEDKAQMRALALDGSSIVEDYTRALKILEQGIPDRDKSWHETAINKAKAQIALQEGRYKEAVDYLRKFMSAVRSWERPEQDPITGVLYSREMCLGRHAKRIGDILTKAGDAKAAADAYVEAKAYYAKALADVKPDSLEAQTINADLAGIK